MAKGNCTGCGRKKGLLAFNYAGKKLQKRRYYPFPNRISPETTPGARATEFLCAKCAQSIAVTCSEHGQITHGVWSLGRPPRCERCIEEKRLGRPPQGYDCIEAVDCPCPPTSFLAAIARAEAYLAAHPCTCGGKWKRVVYNSPMPSGIGDAGYCCSLCGKKKWFRFMHW